MGVLMYKNILMYIFVITIGVSLSGCGKNETIYSISFDANQGNEVSSIEVEEGDSVNLPVSVREGYTFIGWTLTNTDEADVVIDPFYPEFDTTLYAKWRINQYSISFNTDSDTTISPIQQDYDTNVVSPNDPVKDGYIFGGWYVDSELTTMYTFTTMPSEDITLYAKWNEIDWSDVEEYLSNYFPNEVSTDIELPTTYLEYNISWESSNSEAFNNEGIYSRPYQPTTVTMTATIQNEYGTLLKTYDLELATYKSLSAPLASSYVYRDYHTVDDTFFETLDIINCAFITADSNGSLFGTDTIVNITTYIMPEARENGNWVLFSVGPSSEWSDIAASTTKINRFADNIVDMINLFGFDGVDIDWETPTSSEATRFTEMMEVIYTKVKANNPNHLVTAAIAGGMWQPPRYDLENSHQYIDYINMMTYGMVSNNGYYQNALSRSTVFDNPANEVGKTLTSCSIEESVAIYNSYGIPNSKIIVGVAFYGIKQTRTYDSVTQTWSNWTKDTSLSYTYITNIILTNNDYTYYYDRNAGVPYILSNDGTVFISYDNPRSIADKSDYIIENGLAGMMYWEHGHDSTGALLLAMKAGLKDS